MPARKRSVQNAICARRLLRAATAALTAVIIWFAGGVGAAELSVKPTLAVSEEYNDNILLEPVDEKKEYITRISPGLGLRYDNPIWTWDIAYALDYRHFQKGTVKDDTAHALDARNHTELVDNHLFLEVSEEIARASLDIARDFTEHSLIVNQAERNIFSINPSLALKASATMSLTLGYLYRSTRYSRLPAAASAVAIDQFDAVTYAEATADLSSRATVTAGVRHTGNRNSLGNYDRIDIFIGPRYSYARNAHLYFLAGNSRFEYERDQEVIRPYGKAGLSHRLSTITVSLEGARLYIQDPQRVLSRQTLYRVGVRRETPRAGLVLSGEKSAYHDAKSDALLTISRQAQGTLFYRLERRTTGTIGADAQTIEDVMQGIHTKISSSTVRVDHLLARTCTLAFEYRQLRSRSPETAAGNYSNKRYIVELKKAF